MKVALFGNSYLPYLSGITISMSILKDELEALGHTVFVVGPKYPGVVDSDHYVFRFPSLPAPYPGYRLVIPYSHKIFAALKKEKIDLIHVHQPFEVGLSALLLARRMKIPLVYSFHTLFTRYVHHAPFVPQKLAKFVLINYLSFFCNRTDLVIVPSEMVRRYLAVLKVTKPVQVIPTGLRMDTIERKHALGAEHWRAKIRRKHRLPADAKILLYTGRVAPEKNIPFLLQAFPVIKKQEPNAYLLLVGGGPALKEYQALGQQIDQQIIFTGQQSHNDVLDYCFGADLFVYASVTETQGLVITEAKACGLPVVAVFGGGIADGVVDGVDGFLVPQNPAKFVKRVLDVVRNDQLRREMSVQAAADAQHRFSSTVVAKKIESVYNSLIPMRRKTL